MGVSKSKLLTFEAAKQRCIFIVTNIIFRCLRCFIWARQSSRNQTNSPDRQPIKEFRAFLRVLRICKNEGLRVYERFESS